MTFVDRYLQRRRLKRALRALAGARRVIDVGAHRGELFEALGDQLEEGFGIEPLLNAELVGDCHRIVPGRFPQTTPRNGDWDAISLLAVLEHIPSPELVPLAEACHRLLRDRGLVIITVPSPFVDRILWLLLKLRLVDGMSLEQHHGFDPAQVVTLFDASRFELVSHRRFQLGLNHLFILRKTPAPTR